MPNTIDIEPERWPEWLRTVAIRVDELIADSEVLDRWREMLREWKVEKDARAPRVDDGGMRDFGVELLPLRRMSTSEKYATLAAIHDEICESVKRIDPWASHKPLRSTGIPKAKAGIAFTVLRRRVRELNDSSRKRIEETLHDVEQDLANIEDNAGKEDEACNPSFPPKTKSPTDSDEDFRSGQWFALETKIPTARLRQAARPNRKTKRVRKRTNDGVECYSVSDARQWWPNDMTKA